MFYAFMNVDVFMMCIIAWSNHQKDERYGSQKSSFIRTLGLYSHEKANVSYKMFTVIIDEKPLTN